MDRRLFLYLTLFIIFGQQRQQVTAASYELEDAINDISFFIPGSKLILTTALKIWTVYGKLDELAAKTNLTQINKNLEKINANLDIINSKLDDISDHLDDLSEDVKDVKDLINEKVIEGLPKELSLDNKMVTIYGHMQKVSSLFEKFLKYNDQAKRHANDTLLNFAESVVDPGLGELLSTLKQIHWVLTEKHSGVSLLDILANRRQASSMMCKREQSSQYFIINLYNNIMVTEIKGLLMTQFAYSMKTKFNNGTDTYETELEEATKEFYERTSSSVLEIKRAMYHALRDFWRCDPVKHEENVTYARLGPVLQGYVLNEEDAGMNKYLQLYRHKCSDSCPSRHYSVDMCKSGFCKQHKNRCMGYVRDCQVFQNERKLKVCLADEESDHRYNFIELRTQGGFLGKERTCRKDREIKIKHSRDKLILCEYCYCTCETSLMRYDRFFNLRDVVSDVQHNRIITGVRFKKNNHIYHIQIQQGQLLKNGNINGSTLEWKPVDNFSIGDDHVGVAQDYHKITYDERMVNLDSIEAPSNNILTGMRFQLINLKYMKLEVRATPFDFQTGELNLNASRWISGPDDPSQRTELKLEDPDVPTTSFLNYLDSNDKQYIKFSLSSMKKDLGQNMVPFLDIQELTSSPAVPIAGAGLIHRGDEGSGGFLSFKLYTYNFAPHLNN